MCDEEPPDETLDDFGGRILSVHKEPCGVSAEEVEQEPEWLASAAAAVGLQFHAAVPPTAPVDNAPASANALAARVAAAEARAAAIEAENVRLRRVASAALDDWVVVDPLMTLNDLPDEVLEFLLAQLAPHDLRLASLTCGRWAAAVRSDGLWRRLLRRDASPGTSLDAAQSARELYRDRVFPPLDTDAQAGAEPRWLLKLLLLGDAKVGKSAFAYRLLRREALRSREIADLARGSAVVDIVSARAALGGVPLSLQLWDTAAVHRTRTPPLYDSLLRGCHGVFLLFDVTRRASLASALAQFERLRAEEGPRAPERLRVVLVGTKAGESADEQRGLGPAEPRAREVGAEEAHALAATLATVAGHRVPYVECSALAGRGVEEAAAALAQQVLQEHAREAPWRAEPSDEADARTFAMEATLAAGHVAGRLASLAVPVASSVARESAHLAGQLLDSAAPALLGLARRWDEVWESVL